MWVIWRDGRGQEGQGSQGKSSSWSSLAKGRLGLCELTWTIPLDTASIVYQATDSAWFQFVFGTLTAMKSFM